MLNNSANAFALCLLISACVACKPSNSPNSTINTNDTTETYFSVNTFLTNQWSYLKEQPLVLLKTVKEDNKVDSSYVPLDSTLFAEISAPFLASDISTVEDIGKYSFSFSEDNSTDLIFLQYDALEEQLFCRKIVITAQAENKRIISVYIETQKSSFFNSTAQKMNYTTNGTVIIQEYSKDLFYSPDEKIISYFQKY